MKPLRYLTFIFVCSIPLYLSQNIAGGSALLKGVVPGTFIGIGVGQDNHPPEVRFLAPKNGQTYAVQSRVPYSLRISDPEDGESQYEEIPRNQVLLKVQHVSGDALPPDGNGSPGKDPPGLLGILGSNCLNCHAFKGRLIGPSFLDITRKYKAGASDMALMASRIKNGSSGVWGPVVMPGHPELTAREIEEMLRWIMEEAALDKTDYYTGTEGTILLNPPPGGGKEGALLLTAGYTDQGVDGAQRLKGESSIRIEITTE